MFRFRRKKKVEVVDNKRLDDLEQRLASYITREDLKECLEEIESDKRKKELWNSLSNYRKMKILRHVMKKKGAQDGR